MATFAGSLVIPVLLALLVGVVPGCGGGGSTQAAAPPAATVSSGQGSVTAAVSAVETSLLGAALRSGASPALLGISATSSFNSSSVPSFSTSAASSPDLGNCVEDTGSGDGDGFSVLCYCTVDGASSGTITAVFDSSLSEQSCQNDSGGGGSVVSLNGSVTITFSQCVLDGCGDQITLDGSLEGTVVYSFNGCSASQTLDATLATASACTGIVVTHENASTDTMGFSATWSTGTSGNTQSGSACVNGETVDLDGLDAVCDGQSSVSCSAATVSCASDFACQVFADRDQNDAFHTDNVTCVAGCCVVSETGRCSDSEDNDLDGSTDCSDTDCAEDPYCVVGPCGSGTVSCANDFACQVFAETSQTDNFTTNNVSCTNSCCVAASVYETGQCTDGIDNDLDSAADCIDTDCAGDIACGARLPCTNEWQCRALVAGTAIAWATPTCIRYDAGHQYYRYNDGSCEYDCNAAASPADCVNACLPFARTMSNGGFLNNVDKICRVYPPPH